MILHYTQEVLQTLMALSVQRQALAESCKGKWCELVSMLVRAPQRGEEVLLDTRQNSRGVSNTDSRLVLIKVTIPRDEAEILA